MPGVINRKAITLVEIIIATVIISLVMAGLVGVFVVGKRFVLHIRERMASAQLSRLFLDPIQMHVRQDNWDQPVNAIYIPTGISTYTTYCDSDAGHIQNPACPSVADDRKVNNTVYTGQYDTENVSGTDLRRVSVKIGWQEPAP